MFQVEMLYGLVFGFLAFVVIAMFSNNFEEPKSRKSIKIPVRTSDSKGKMPPPWKEEAVATPDFQWIILIIVLTLISLILVQTS